MRGYQNGAETLLWLQPFGWTYRVQNGLIREPWQHEELVVGDNVVHGFAGNVFHANGRHGLLGVLVEEQQRVQFTRDLVFRRYVLSLRHAEL